MQGICRYYMYYKSQRIVGKYTSPMDAMGLKNNQISNEKYMVV